MFVSRGRNCEAAASCLTWSSFLLIHYVGNFVLDSSLLLHVSAACIYSSKPAAEKTCWYGWSVLLPF